MEALLGGDELSDVVLAHVWRRLLGNEAFEFAAHKERLPEFVARKRPDSHAAVRHEGNKAKSRQLAKGLSDGGAANLKPFRELLLAQGCPGLKLTGDNRLLNH